MVGDSEEGGEAVPFVEHFLDGVVVFGGVGEEGDAEV